MTLLFNAPEYSVSSYCNGIGLRLWEMAQVLSAHVDVVILHRGSSDFSHPQVRLVEYTRDAWRTELEQATCVLFTDLPSTADLLEAYDSGKQIICDNAVPLEHLEYASVRRSAAPDDVYSRIVRSFEVQVTVSDHFLYRSDVEHATLISCLALNGRLSYVNYDRGSTLDHLLSRIPIGFNRYSERLADNAETAAVPRGLVWSGGVWDYFNPLAVIEAVEETLRRGGPVPTRFLYLPPPHQDVSAGQQLLDRIAASPAAKWITVHKDTLRHVDRDAYLRGASGLICIGRRGIENSTCVRLRLRDSLLYRLPLIIDNAGATGAYVAMAGIGIPVDPDDITAVADAMQQVHFDRSYGEQVCRRLEVTRENHRLEHNVEGLLDFLRRGLRAPDAGTPVQRRRLESLFAAQDAPTSLDRIL